MRRQKKSYPEIISADSPDYSRRAAAVIREGGIVAYPTETYYGLGVNPFDSDALSRLFKVKQRLWSKAILVIIDDIDQLSMLIAEFPEPYRPLIEQYWPGPLTLVFPALHSLPDLLTGGSGTIGVRMSSSATATAICKASRIPVSATSANISGEPPATCVADVLRYFNETIDLVIDGGENASPQCSTIVALADGAIQTLRHGVISISND